MQVRSFCNSFTIVLRLARFFGTSDRFWLNLQAAYDLDVERDRHGARIERGPGFREGQLSRDDAQSNRPMELTAPIPAIGAIARPPRCGRHVG